jgi:hypothetical protein
MFLLPQGLSRYPLPAVFFVMPQIGLDRGSCPLDSLFSLLTTMDGSTPPGLRLNIIHSEPWKLEGSGQSCPLSDRPQSGQAAKPQISCMQRTAYCYKAFRMCRFYYVCYYWPYTGLIREMDGSGNPTHRPDPNPTQLARVNPTRVTV